MHRSNMPLQTGTRLGPYEVLSQIGAGGMGEVWLATEVHLRRRVALKLLPSDLTGDPTRVTRFEQEARAASALSHPNVCVIHALGVTADGQHYIAMEYVEGQTLRQRLSTSRIALREALDIATQVGAALSAAHSAGIIHRDIKPENVMLRPDGLVKVLDFGLAKLVSTALDITGAGYTRTVLETEAGVVLGTAAYMSPEQARSQEVDARTDMWSLGVTLYEMVAGRPPFSALSGTEVLAAILDREPAPLARFDPDTPAELQRIVAKALRKPREQRYQTVHDLLLDLQALREDLQVQARVASGSATPAALDRASQSTQSGAPTGRRIGQRVLAIVAAMFALGVAGGIWWWRTPRLTESPSATAGVPVSRNLTRVTFGAGLQKDVTFSPDGRFIAYSSDRSGNLDIWVQPVTGGDAVRITRNVAHDMEPDWSPDGSRIVFRSERDGGGVFIVPALGGAERRLTRFGAYPRWSSNGSEIVFCVDSVGGTGSPQAVYTVPSTGGEPQELIREFTRQGVWNWAAPHPDGAISVIGSHRERGFGFFTVSRGGRTVRPSKLQKGVPLLIVERFQWSASGTVVYAAAETDGVQNLWKVRVNAQTLHWESAERLTTGAGPDSAPALSRDGRQLAFTVRSESAQIVAYPFDAAAGRVLGEGRPLTDQHEDTSLLVLSHDGRRLAYSAKEVGSRTTELRIRDMADGLTETVVLERGEAWPGAWSRDGRALAFEVYHYDGGRTRLAAVVRSRDRPEFSIMPWSQESMFQPSDWTPDGNGVLGTYQKPLNTGPGWLVVWPSSGAAATEAQTVLVDDPKLRLWQARYSPDGRWIAFVAAFVDEPGRVDMVAMPAAGTPRTEWVRLASSLETADKPRWSPDGKVVYFVARHASYSGYNVWGVNFDSARGVPVREPFRVTSFDSPTYMLDPRTSVAEFGVSRDRLVLPMVTRASSIWMLDNVDK
jgi:serine/threonine protein kinase/Tol biopolymer transport system component